MARVLVPIALAGCVLACVATADARQQVDLIVSGGISPPSNSDYRSQATQMGYDTRGKSLQYEVEVGATFGVAVDGWLTVGPLLRASIGRLGSPYDGVQPITMDAGFACVRAEAAVFDYPRLFFWGDVGLGVTSIGQPGGYFHGGAWEFRGGVGMRVGTDAGGARLRVGYGTAPTFSDVRRGVQSGFDFGGFVLAIDGVLRVLG
jgi:hypothetical protein